MYYKLIIYTVLLLSAFSLSAQQLDNNSQLKELDKTIDNSLLYINQKYNKINYLKQILKVESNSNRIYNISYQIIEEYSNFQADSAFKYIALNRLLAQKNNSKDQILSNRLQYAFVTAQSGLLNESEYVLKSLQSQLPQFSPSQKSEYYKHCERLYMNLAEFTQKTHLEDFYRQKAYQYTDSILMFTNPDSEYYDLYSFKNAFYDKDLEKSKSSIKNFILKIDTLSNDAARGYYHMSEIYRAEGDKEKELHFLIKSVNADIKSAVKQNRSMRVLAQILYDGGDIKRAYKYLQISLDDANFYNTRLRNTQVAEAMPIIEKDYQIQRNEQEFRLKVGFIIIATLFVIILLFSIYLRKKRKELAVARKELLLSNESLTSINEEINKKNSELQQLATKLKESDQIKEKYIGHFLKLCSTYIQSIGDYKKLVNRKVKAGQFEDLHNMTLANTQLANEFKDFYREFDKAFLNIFPNFVDEFNKLLREGQQFSLKKEDLLNAELRIFALIRLGIKDSSQIADFMNYTPVTIYSYRTKVKSRAINKDTFDQDILQIER